MTKLLKLVLDSRTKQRFVEAVSYFLYYSVLVQLDATKKNIIFKNAMLGRYSHASFMYQGTLYSEDSNPLPRKGNKLIPELVPAMKAYQTEYSDIVYTEKPIVMGYITRVLNLSNDSSVCLKLYPESLHSLVCQHLPSIPAETAVNYSQDFYDNELVLNEKAISLLKRRMVLNLLI